MTTLLPLTGGSSTGLDLGSTYGVMLISTIIVAVLYGFSLLQTLYYYEKFSHKDPWVLKTAVATLWVLDTLTVAFDCHALYYYLINNYGNTAVLQQETWSAQAELLVAYTIVLIVQIFFIQRMYHLRPHMWYIPAFLAVLAVASWVMIIAIFSDVLHDTYWADTGGPTVTTLLKVNWLLGMIVDGGITIVLCWYLWSEKGMVRHRTNLMLNKMIIFMVHRGAVAAQIQVLTLVTKLVFPDTLIWLAFHNGLSKVYTNSMLAILNARVSLQKIIMDTELDTTKPPSATVFRSPGMPTSNLGSSHPRRSTNGNTLQFAPNPELDPTSTKDIADLELQGDIQLVSLPFQGSSQEGSRSGKSGSDDGLEQSYCEV